MRYTKVVGNAVSTRYCSVSSSLKVTQSPQRGIEREYDKYNDESAFGACTNGCEMPETGLASEQSC
jgi:hypothetical protein